MAGHPTVLGMIMALEAEGVLAQIFWFGPVRASGADGYGPLSGIPEPRS
jgi:hypothetical protein